MDDISVAENVQKLSKHICMLYVLYSKKAKAMTFAGALPPLPGFTRPR